jgi:hypothetical protein
MGESAKQTVHNMLRELTPSRSFWLNDTIRESRRGVALVNAPVSSLGQIDYLNGVFSKALGTLGPALNLALLFSLWSTLRVRMPLWNGGSTGAHSTFSTKSFLRKRAVRTDHEPRRRPWPRRERTGRLVRVAFVLGLPKAQEFQSPWGTSCNKSGRKRPTQQRENQQASPARLTARDRYEAGGWGTIP